MNVRLKATVELLQFFKRRYSSEFVGGRIGIITPYKAERLILSTVRAADSSSSMNGLSSNSIGFVADTNQNWAALVKDAKERNLVISAKQPYESLFETAPRDACKRERITNSIRSVTRCHNTVAGDGKNFYIQSSNRKAREEHDLPGKMDVKSVIPGESVTGDESKGKERSEKKLGSGEQRNLLKVREARGIWSSTSSDEGSLKSKEVNDGKDPNPVGACLDMITKRKQQREAVKAILNSSSKKSEPSTKPMSSKRPPPTSVVSGGIRPPKTRKDSVFEILAEPILSSLKVYGKKAGLILNIKVNHGLDKFGLRVVVHCYRPPRQYNIGFENTEKLLV
ncbi:hypothetical protein SADUNF_Sadunf19G0027500 [Salix dunnii]|uniref:DNA2/NAM7 helicase-like C-terminal domain-containing protein n=1 Tax=Salix dunnii TaxID=1413687 RepID=A0A835J3I9_9ROSI|nr:hypothetical protein SADUNF_Sadunf19G0027500 [Salix dunnii]